MAQQMTADEGFGLHAGRAHFAALDGLRFVAILSVVFHHSPLTTAMAPWSVLFTRGFLGVDFFFVISGFLITSLLLRERERKGRVSLAGFYKRRALRILPLYYLVVTAIGGYYVLLRGSADAADYWPFYYLFLANFLVGDIPMLSPTWSLSVEEQYYMVWPLLLIALPRRFLLWGVALATVPYVIVIESGLGFARWPVGPLNISLQLTAYLPILMGAALAILLERRESFTVLWRMLGHRWASVGFWALLIAELALLPGNLSGWPYPVVHLTMTALIGSLVIREDTPLMPLLTLQPVVRIGMISYGIYLLHHLARHFAVVITERFFGAPADHLAFFMFLFVGGSILLAEISFRFYERPFLALRHKPLGFIARLPTLSKRKSSS